ncbi:putative transcription initiation factor IID, 18kD subunit [Lyophyllum shimeji]|uniref:Transcription initiation factor TFIID subunit 13 n=1 Tax=Lyophyllum shimeji TaxID=47721 RepID=A0A9P3UIV0_LYOSH|nr:putative transcription initiation factor IID, 18kD subunit [Lyophyllum shimeji]
MAYPHYTPPPGTHPPTSTTYPYGAYHPTPHAAYGHPQTSGAYSYQPSAYQTGVTGYGWTYPYTYMPHPAQPTHTPTPAHTPTPVTAHTPATTAATVTQAPQPPRPPTLTSYTPSYTRESVAAAATGGATGRGPRKQSSVKGLFTKELKSLMYGFGDDRNPANDTVNVMEEILVEYITDVCLTAGASSRKTRLSIEDLRRALSRPADAKKLARMEELLFMQEDIKREPGPSHASHRALLIYRHCGTSCFLKAGRRNSGSCSCDVAGRGGFGDW